MANTRQSLGFVMSYVIALFDNVSTRSTAKKSTFGDLLILPGTQKLVLLERKKCDCSTTVFCVYILASESWKKKLRNNRTVESTRERDHHHLA